MSGKLHLERVSVDLEDVARAALNVVQPAADAKHVRLEANIDSDVGTVYADKARLQQIAWNLLSNAIKFTPQDGTVRMRLRRVDDDVELVVSDSGVGIPSHFLGSVFEPFLQADGSTTRRHGGLGLGLSIVKHLVVAHGGVVSAHSAGEGHGATFIVRLPTEAGAEQDESGRGSATRPAHPVLPPTLLDGLTVLVVDDEEHGRQVAAAHLESHQAVVITAASAAEAIEVLRRQHVDVLISDIAMPDEDGYALIHKIRALLPAPIAAIPAAALTALARNDDRVKAVQAGFRVHLAKPIDGNSLVAAVARLGGKLAARPGATELAGRGEPI
jgi:CheY-like chemotaxis protein